MPRFWHPSCWSEPYVEYEWVEVSADLVIQATFILGNGFTISQDFFNALTVPAGSVTRSSWYVSVPLASLRAANLTAYPRMIGPISETSRTYRVP